jgi:hypothetical protein
MLDIEKDTARTIIDALAVAIDGKPSSAKNFNQFPYEYPADCDQQGTQGMGEDMDRAPKPRPLDRTHAVRWVVRLPYGLGFHP